MNLPIPCWPPDWPEIEAAALEAIRGGNWGRYASDVSDQLRDRLAVRHGVSHVRLTCSGSAAIEIALRLAGVGLGDEVILSAYDYPGNLRAIELVGARPVLVDVAEKSVAPNVSALETAASEHVKAVIVSHLNGIAADAVAFRTLCDSKGWVLIEDACQVPGMTIHGRPAGSIGHIGTLSFGGSKPLTAGCGGAVLTDSPRLAARFGPLLDRPSDATPLSPLQASVLLPQLDRLDEENERRRATVRYLEESVLKSLPRWSWRSQSQVSAVAAHYKVAWAAESREHRAAVIRKAAEMNLPIGDGFRDTSRTSVRRCRKPQALSQAADLGKTLFVLDHSALRLPAEDHRLLAECLIELHESTQP